jgi:hypothetical protein
MVVGSLGFLVERCGELGAPILVLAPCAVATGEPFVMVPRAPP